MKLLEYFDIGVEYKKSGLSEYDFLKSYDSGDLGYDFFMLGFKNCKKPVKATGWRYGEFTDYGKSMNYASGKKEKGISLMEIFVNEVSMEKASTASELFFGNGDKKIYWVSGYWTPDIWGGDGEPLMICAEHYVL